MGKKSAGSPPAAPDPNAIIDKQKEANRIDTFTPYGSTEFQTLPDGRTRSVSRFSPATEAIFSQALSSSLPSSALMPIPNPLNVGGLNVAQTIAGVPTTPQESYLGIPQIVTNQTNTTGTPTVPSIQNLISGIPTNTVTPPIPEQPEPEINVNNENTTESILNKIMTERVGNQPQPNQTDRFAAKVDQMIKNALGVTSPDPYVKSSLGSLIDPTSIWKAVQTGEIKPGTTEAQQEKEIINNIVSPQTTTTPTTGPQVLPITNIIPSEPQIQPINVSSGPQIQPIPGETGPQIQPMPYQPEQPQVLPMPTDPNTIGSTNNANEQRDKYQKEYYDKLTSLLNRSFDRNENRLISRLANRGIPVGSEAYTDEYDTVISDPRERAYEQAGLQALSNAENYRLNDFNLASQAQNIYNATNQQNFAQNLATRQFNAGLDLQKFNRLMSLLNGFQPVTPNPVDVTGPYNLNQNAQNAAYQVNAQNAAQNRQSIGTLAALALLA